jgi:NAD(P)-dependent dehydrogenase (short-subunit alcohol dehydrogenase family)
MRIAGSTVLIVGGASGLGEAVGLSLADQSASVLIGDRRKPGNGAAAGFRYFPIDVTVPAQVSELFRDVAREYPRIDAMVTTAGLSGRRAVLGESGEMFPLEDFRRLVEVNLIGVFDVARHAARAMAVNEPSVDGERGVLIHVASAAAHEGQVGHAGYAAAKAGLVALNLPLARELGERGIRVVSISPSAFETPMVNEKLRAQITQWAVYPRRFGRGGEFAQLVASILENPMINACDIRLDAGARLGWHVPPP